MKERATVLETEDAGRTYRIWLQVDWAVEYAAATHRTTGFYSGTVEAGVSYHLDWLVDWAEDISHGVDAQTAIHALHVQRKHPGWR